VDRSHLAEVKACLDDGEAQQSILFRANLNGRRVRRPVLIEVASQKNGLLLMRCCEIVQDTER
jgi:hypothetical protein